MKATVSGIAGRSELVTGRACGKSMRALVLFLRAVVLAGLPEGFQERCRERDLPRSGGNGQALSNMPSEK